MVCLWGLLIDHEIVWWWGAQVHSSKENEINFVQVERENFNLCWRFVLNKLCRDQIAAGYHFDSWPQDVISSPQSWVKERTRNKSERLSHYSWALLQLFGLDLYVLGQKEKHFETPSTNYSETVCHKNNQLSATTVEEKTKDRIQTISKLLLLSILSFTTDSFLLPHSHVTLIIVIPRWEEGKKQYVVCLEFVFRLLSSLLFLFCLCLNSLISLIGWDEQPIRDDSARIIDLWIIDLRSTVTFQQSLHNNMFKCWISQLVIDFISWRVVAASRCRCRFVWPATEAWGAANWSIWAFRLDILSLLWWQRAPTHSSRHWKGSSPATILSHLQRLYYCGIHMV